MKRGVVKAPAGSKAGYVTMGVFFSGKSNAISLTMDNFHISITETSDPKTYARLADAMIAAGLTRNKP